MEKETLEIANELWALRTRVVKLEDSVDSHRQIIAVLCLLVFSALVGGLMALFNF